MHTTLGRTSAAWAWIVAVVCAAPLTAQQYANPPAQAPPRTVQRGPAQPGAAPRATAQQPAARAPAGQMPRTQPQRAPAGSAPAPRAGGVRQAAAQEPLPPNGQPPAARAAAPGPAQAPFTLTPQQQQLLDQILLKWEQQSDRVKSFKCSFRRWEVNETFGPKEYNYYISDAQGYIKYKTPDHGTYKITTLSEWDDQKKAAVPRTTGLDHWVCNGESIFEFNAQKRQLIERPLAPNMRGKAIANGPLPFVFGTKADQLKNRYWMRDITPPGEAGTKVWLEAWPKFQADAANFQHAIVILDQGRFLPEALRIVLPDGKNRQEYKFDGIQVNDPLSIVALDFIPPITPLGWQKVVEQMPVPGQPDPAAAPAAGRVPAGALR